MGCSSSVIEVNILHCSKSPVEASEKFYSQCQCQVGVNKYFFQFCDPFQTFVCRHVSLFFLWFWGGIFLVLKFLVFYFCLPGEDRAAECQDLLLAEQEYFQEYFFRDLRGDRNPHLGWYHWGTFKAKPRMSASHRFWFRKLEKFIKDQKLPKRTQVPEMIRCWRGWLNLKYPKIYYSYIFRTSNGLWRNHQLGGNRG